MPYSRRTVASLFILGGTLAAIAGAAVSLISLVGARPGNLDDGFILIVYVRHLLESSRFYWNIEEGNVDGFTSMLDLLVKTAACFFSRDDLLRTCWKVNALFQAASGAGAGVLAALALWLSRGRQSRKESTAASSTVPPSSAESASTGRSTLRQALARLSSPWLVNPLAIAGSLTGAFVIASSPALATGTSFVLETPLYVFTLLVAVGTLVLFDHRGKAAAWALGASWLAVATCRPEGAPLAGVLALGYLIRHRDVPRRLRYAPVVGYAGAYAAYLLWHTLVFGHWAPNTYYAKASDSRWFELLDGLAYLKAFAAKPHGFWIVGWGLLSPILAFLPGWSPRVRWSFLTVSLAAMASLIVLVVSGGDCYPGDRFLAGPSTLVGASAVLAVVGLGNISILVPILFLAVVAYPQRRISLWNIPKKVATARSTWPPLASKDFVKERLVTATFERAGFRSMAQNNLQVCKYFSDTLRVIDITGLNDEEIAHKPHPIPNLWGKDGVAEALARNPDVISYGYRTWAWARMADHPIGEFVRNPRLAERFIGYGLPQAMADRYRSASVPAGGIYLSLLVREDLVPRARAAGIIVEGP